MHLFTISEMFLVVVMVSIAGYKAVIWKCLEKSHKRCSVAKKIVNFVFFIIFHSILITSAGLQSQFPFSRSRSTYVGLTDE